MYQANTDHPFVYYFTAINPKKYVGIDFIISQILERMGDVSRIFFSGRLC